jgi:peptidoglycan/LPS O-acetylase OafA/YrhL
MPDAVALPTRADPPARLAGLDSIRAILALVVVFGHAGALPLIDGIDRSSRLGWLIASVYGNSVSGPAAVVVFFVISGFCIHYPFRNGKPIPLLSYYSRRYLRVLVPMGAAILLGKALGVELTLLKDSILWSLIAEEIYYLLYPALRRLRQFANFRVLIVLAQVCAVLVVLRDPHAGNYASFGPAFNWVVGLPCWLMGCELAEIIGKPRPVPSARRVGLWVFGVWVASVACSALRFHSPLKYPWTLNLFALLGAAALLRALTFYMHHAPSPRLERMGGFSYSLYLVHLHGMALFERFHLPYLGSVLMWALEIGTVIGLAYVFGRVVERPAHALARRVAELCLRSTSGSLARAPAEIRSEG